MPRPFTPRTSVKATTRRLAVSVNTTVGTLHHRAARFTSAGNDSAIRSDGCPATCGLAMGINVSVRAFDHRTTCFASASSRAIGSNHCTAFASGTMRDGRTVGSLGDVARRARFTSCSGVERV